MKGGTAAYKAFNDQRNKWTEKYLKSKGIVRNTNPTGPVDAEGGGSSGMGVDLDYIEAEKKAHAAWLGTLDPATRAKAEAEFRQHSADMDSVNKVGKTAALGVIGASGLGAALTGAGVIGGGAAGAGGGTATTGGVTAAEIAGAAGVPELGLATQTGLGGGLLSGGAGTIGKIASAVGGVMSGGSGGGGGSAFRNTLLGDVSGDQEDLNDAMYKAFQDSLGFSREQFDYYKAMTDKQYALGQDTFNWQRGLADEDRARAAKYDKLYDETTGRQLRAFSDEVDAYNAPAEGLRRSGRAVADVENQLATARGANIRGLTSRGWNPNSAAMQSSMGDLELEGALAKSTAATMAYEAARREGLQLRAQAAGLGQQNAGVATANSGQASQAAQNGMNASTTGLAPSFTNLGLYNQGQNTAIGWGNAANSGFNSMRQGNSSWSDNLNYGSAILGGLRGYANNGLWGAAAGAAGGLLSGY